MKIEFDCVVCGKRVVKIRSPANLTAPPRYCSQKCHGEARLGTGSGLTPNHNFTCERCGRAVSVHRTPSAPPPRFCSIGCLGLAQHGEANPAFTGGRYLNTGGYVMVLRPDHPEADPRGYVYEHRLVASEALGRALRPGEVVHHKNEVKDDNRPENLHVFASQAEHVKHHAERAHAQRI